MTAEELLYTNVPNKRTELVRGRLVVHEPPGGKHGNVTANLGARLWTLQGVRTTATADTASSETRSPL
jgi:Uma2 family endonuclease